MFRSERKLTVKLIQVVPDLLTPCIHESDGRTNIMQALKGSNVHVMALSKFAERRTGTSFDQLVKDKWEDMQSQGLLKYAVDPKQKTERLPGKHGFIKTLVVGRATKKRVNMKLDSGVKHVVQAFDPKIFNFQKAAYAELLFAVVDEALTGEDAELSQAPLVCTQVGEAVDTVVVNVSPIDYGNILLVPAISQGLPQQLSSATIQKAIGFQLAATAPNFRVGFNGLGGFASVNHLHFQGYFIGEHGGMEGGAPISINSFPIEHARLSLLTSSTGYSVHELVDYPVPGLCFEATASLVEKPWREFFTTAVMRCVDALVGADIPHNFLLAPAATSRSKPLGFRLYLLPQKSFVRTDPAEIGPAFPEISGHILVKREPDFDTMDEEAVGTILKKVAISPESFQRLKECVK